jgi:hypothetical protein
MTTRTSTNFGRRLRILRTKAGLRGAATTTIAKKNYTAIPELPPVIAVHVNLLPLRLRPRVPMPDVWLMGRKRRLAWPSGIDVFASLNRPNPIEKYFRNNPVILSRSLDMVVAFTYNI